MSSSTEKRVLLAETGGGGLCSMLGKLHGNFRGPGDLWEFLRTGWRLLVAQRAKHRMPLQRLLAAFTPPLARRGDEERIPVLNRYVYWWLTRSWFPVQPNCWTRCLVLFELMRRNGIRGVKLHVGVAGKGGDILGHAWLTRDGELFLEPDWEEVRGMKLLFEHPPDDPAGGRP